ncbi:MAG TPA: polysaccharide deacetylase family protein [Leptolyngbyaceae cyanobacterium]
MKVLQLPKKVSKPIVLVGIGGLLLGAAAPFVGVINSGLGKPHSVDSALVAFTNSPGVEAFPARVSNERVCQRAVASTTEAQTPLINPLTGLQHLSALMAANNLMQLPQVEWPNINDQARLARVPIVMYHDVLTKPEVFFDLTPEQLETQLKEIVARGLTPVSLDQVVQHLRMGTPLPEKPILLTFDDGYAGHFEHVYPLLKKYQMPAVFSIFPGKLDGKVAGRSTITWQQLKEMASDPLITIASHSVTHPPNLTQVSDDQLRHEVVDSKSRLEAELGIPIKYFTYPAGYYDKRVEAAVAEAGYLAALTMRESDEKFAGESESLLSIERFGQSNLSRLLDEASGGSPLPSNTVLPNTVQIPHSVPSQAGFNFSVPIQVHEVTLENIPLTLISGGRPVTVHANSRYQVPEILASTNAIAAVDGGFFSLEYLDSNVMIGPVLSQSTRTFIPGNASENPRLNGRPLVLITPQAVKFVPFEAIRHNTLGGLQQTAPGVTDAFVAAGWLVKDGQPQPGSSFGTLYGFDAERHRAFWGINRAGEPVVGVSQARVDAVRLGQLLAQAGLENAVMLDSGASTSLAYQGQSLIKDYEPRPVPHIVALIPPEQAQGACPLALKSPLSQIPQ